MALIDQAVSEKKIFENGGRRTDDVRRTNDGRRLDGYTISPPCEPNGSGELIISIIQISAGVSYIQIHWLSISVFIMFSHGQNAPCADSMLSGTWLVAVVCELRNRPAQAVNCCVIIHCLEVSCKEDQIMSASDLSSYN